MTPLFARYSVRFQPTYIIIFYSSCHYCIRRLPLQKATCNNLITQFILTNFLFSFFGLESILCSMLVTCHLVRGNSIPNKWLTTNLRNSCLMPSSPYISLGNWIITTTSSTKNNNDNCNIIMIITMLYDNNTTRRIRSKYICRPRVVVEVGNHFVWEFRAGHVAAHVPDTLAVMHHYRTCEFGGETCLANPSVQDRSAWKYGDSLVTAVRMRFHQFAAEGCPALLNGARAAGKSLLAAVGLPAPVASVVANGAVNNSTVRRHRSPLLSWWELPWPSLRPETATWVAAPRVKKWHLFPFPFCLDRPTTSRLHAPLASFVHRRLSPLLLPLHLTIWRRN